MSPETGEYLMLWTVRASVACYVIALWRWLFVKAAVAAPGDFSAPHPDRLYSVCWLTAWLLCVLHVICAFHFRHHWVHSVAIQHTAEMTERVVGIHWGGGLYINYLFLTCWGISAVQSQRSGGLQTLSRRRLQTILHAFAAFMMFNATAIFGPLWWWIPTLAVSAAVAYRMWTSWRQNTGHETS